MKELSIGKLPDNHIVVDNRMVSRHHAKILLDREGRFEIFDLESKNGTFVNGRRVRGSQSIRPGDRIMVANANLPNDWVRYFDQIPDDEPERVVESQPVPSMLDPELLSSVLYDFDKEVDVMFARQGEYLKQIITDFKQNRLPDGRQISVRNYSEEMLDLLIERYDFIGKQLSLLLNRMARESAAFQSEYDSDMQKLDVTYQYYMRNSKGETDLAANLKKVDVRRDEMKSHYEALCKEVLPIVYSIIEDYYKNNPPLFTERLELAPADSPIWKNLNNPDYEIQKTFYLGEEVLHFTILQKPVDLKRRVYVQSLYGGNLLFKFSKKHRKCCFDAVNSLIFRMLAATESGKLKVVMVDFGEMEGTGNEFKRLEESVFKVISSSDEFTKELNSVVAYSESVIRNYLQGEITNLAEYNRTKTEKVPYTLWVLKDIPVGHGDFGGNLVKILRNGPRTGVSLIVLMDEEDTNRSDESMRVFRQLQKALTSVPIGTCDFNIVSSEYELSNSPKIAHSESFSNVIISKVVEKINQGLKVKPEPTLVFSEYMLPEEDWWSGESASRIDIPFGLTTDRKTKALQFTQVSGQNSAVVIGKPGSGKSAFLHDIIASAITHYSPKELQLYLLDFSGVEFNVYANHKLPHARVIAPEAEREFGLSILNEVREESRRRTKLFNENDANSIVELKRKNPGLVVPRLLVIIDEFQKLFEIDDDNITSVAMDRIHAIVQEYRKFGINLILSTQKLPSETKVRYEMVANRVVFDSEPEDFKNLTNWPFSVPKPKLSVGTCVYNDKSGNADANCVTRSYFITPDELDDLLERVTAYSNAHPEKNDDHDLRVFRSRELPKFSERVVAENHREPKDTPDEVGVYVGESIAIAKSHVYVPLTKNSNNNILVIGGDPNVAKGIAYYAMKSAIAAHTKGSCDLILMNFMKKEDPMRHLFGGNQFADVSANCEFKEAKSAEDVKAILQSVDKEIELRKSDPSKQERHIFISIFEFQFGRMFDSDDNEFDKSECALLLEKILKNGPVTGVFTILQVDNVKNLETIKEYSPQKMFCHRIALQMSMDDSLGVVGNSTTANKLQENGRPESKNRALYYNNVNNTFDKFKPYDHEFLRETN